MAQSAPSGLPAVPQLYWGSHLTHVFEVGDELKEVLVPYFTAGLENNELCLWVTGPGFNSEDARAALRAVVSDLSERERSGQIEIAAAEDWYKAGQKVDPRALLAGLLQREQQALDRGYVGFRASGNCAWVSRQQWSDFQEYELMVRGSVRGRRMICLCSYCLDQVRNGSQIDILTRHDLVVPSVRGSARLRHADTSWDKREGDDKRR